MVKYLKVEVYRENVTLNFNKYMKHHTDITLRINTVEDFKQTLRLTTKFFREGKYLFKCNSVPLFSGMKKKSKWDLDKFNARRKKHIMWALVFDYEDVKVCR